MQNRNESILLQAWAGIYSSLAKQQVADLLNYLVPYRAQPKSGALPSFNFDILEFAGKTGNLAREYWATAGHNNSRYNIFEPWEIFNLHLKQEIARGHLNGLCTYESLPSKGDYDLVLCAQGPWKVSIHQSTPYLWLLGEQTTLGEFRRQISQLANCGTIIAIDKFTSATRGRHDTWLPGKIAGKPNVHVQHLLSQISSGAHQEFDPQHSVSETVTLRAADEPPLLNEIQVWRAVPLELAIQGTGVEVVKYEDSPEHPSMQSKQFFTLAKAM